MDDFTLNIEQHRENYFPDQFLYQDDEYDRVFLDNDFTYFSKYNIKCYTGILYRKCDKEDIWDISSGIDVLIDGTTGEYLYAETMSYGACALHNYVTSRAFSGRCDGEDTVWWYDGTRYWFRLGDDTENALERSDEAPFPIDMDYPSLDKESA